jgi:large subunit ribosomal protein L25
MKVELRNEPLRVVRALDKVPGVVFGKAFDPISIQVDEKELQATVNEFGLTQTFKIKVSKLTHTVYIKEIQRDAIKHSHFLNVKLQKVGKGDTITARIPLNIIGKELVEKGSVSVQIISDNVEVEYEVGKGVSHIDLDVSALTVGSSIHVNELAVPKGFKVLDNPDSLILNIIEARELEPETEEGAIDENDYDPTNVEATKQKSDQ